MARLLIPTRNRPTSLTKVIGFLERFYPGTEVIVADGSADQYAEENRRNMTAPERGGLVDYRRYPYDMPLHARIVDVLRDISDPYVIMGSDDDYPFMDTLARAQKRLEERPSAVTAMGPKIGFTMYGPGQAIASLVVARNITAPDIKTRCASFSRWQFSTTYAVTRRELLIERFERAQVVFLTGFYDFGVGLHDAACGEILALPDFCYVMTRNYTHSYLRPEGDLNFIHKADEVLTLQRYLVDDLVARGGFDREEAQAFADELYQRKIVGGRFSGRRNFETSSLFTGDLVQSQIRLYENLFRAGTPEREAYAERLGTILEALGAAAGSTDNLGEDKALESLDRQMEAGRGAESRGEQPIHPFTGFWNTKRYADPINLVRRVDPETLVWLDDPGAELHVLVLGDTFGAEDGADRTLAEDAGPVWRDFAARLAEAGIRGALRVSTPAAGGASIADWQDGAAPAALDALLARLAESEPPPFVLWHVAGASGIGYEAVFDAVHARLAEALPEVRIFVCRTEGARDDEERIIARYGNTLAGPDMGLAALLGAEGTRLLFEALREPLRAWQRTQTAEVAPVRPRSLRRGRQKEGRAPGGDRGRQPSPDAPSD